MNDFSGVFSNWRLDNTSYRTFHTRKQARRETSCACSDRLRCGKTCRNLRTRAPVCSGKSRDLPADWSSGTLSRTSRMSDSSHRCEWLDDCRGGFFGGTFCGRAGTRKVCDRNEFWRAGLNCSFSKMFSSKFDTDIRFSTRFARHLNIIILKFFNVAGCLVLTIF